MHGEGNPFRNGLKPVAELAADKPHGNRIRYMSGCRCVPCRAANSNYETTRAAARKRGEWNGVVSANRARRHLLLLSRREIGRDTVADITGIAPSTLDLIRRGKRKNLRAMNEKKILAIELDSIVNDAMRIPATKTWEQIRWLLANGFTKGSLALRLGYKTRALQLNRKKITAKNAMRVELLYNQLRAGDPDLERDTLERFLEAGNGNAASVI
jgi:hypothetical protein